jgi:DNA processing protein
MERNKLLFIYSSSYNHISSADILSYLQGDTSSGKSRLNPQGVKKIAGKSEFLETAEKIIAFCGKHDITIITYLDPTYPEKLRNIESAPPVLYVRGDSSVLEGFSGAVVGSRKPTLSGLRFCRNFVGEMVLHGIPVISGFARGIDSCAHRASLEMNGKTVAVLGSGVDVIYPRENEKLYSEVVEAGCVLSRFPPGTKPMGRNFPVRNSIIAALTDFVCVIEAARRSGSLITARFGAEYGKEVFSVPGNPLFPQSEGTNGLIKMGAHPLTGISDILEAFGLSPGKRRVMSDEKTKEHTDNLTKLERTLLDLLTGEMSLEEISSIANDDIGQVSAAMVTLEMKNRVKRGGDGYYFRLV